MNMDVKGYDVDGSYEFTPRFRRISESWPIADARLRWNRRDARMARFANDDVDRRIPRQ